MTYSKSAICRALSHNGGFKAARQSLSSPIVSHFQCSIHPLFKYLLTSELRFCFLLKSFVTKAEDLIDFNFWCPTCGIIVQQGTPGAILPEIFC